MSIIDADKTFTVESDIFKNANFDTSSVAPASDINNDEPEVEYPRIDDDFFHQNQPQQPQQHAQQERERPRPRPTSHYGWETDGYFSAFWAWVKDMFLSMLNLASYLLHKGWIPFIIFASLLLAYLLAPTNLEGFSSPTTPSFSSLTDWVRGYKYPIFSGNSTLTPKDVERLVQDAVSQQVKEQVKETPGDKHKLDRMIKDAVAKHMKEHPAPRAEAPKRGHTKYNYNWDTQVNHWSHGTGATIDPDPAATSKNFLFPSMKAGLFTKSFRYMMRNKVPIPNPPEAALRKWDEHGDCWCTHADGVDGFGGSIGVVSGASIYPQEVVVEHIPSTASLQPGATPKDMELWAYFEDWPLHDDVVAESKALFPSESRDVLVQQTMGYIRVATWTFDIESENIQAFPVQLDLKSFSAHTNKLIIRAKNNWGGGNVDYTCLYRLRVHGDIALEPES